MYRTVIIDDDPLSQEILKDIIHSDIDDCIISEVYSSVNEAIAGLPRLDFDLLFLDMELQDGYGFDVLKALTEVNFEVIITTMHDSFMLEAIKHSAIDYLMKPITSKALKEAMERFELRMARRRALEAASSNKPLPKNRLVIPNQNGLVLVEIENILRMESEGAYTRIVMAGGASHLASKNLGFYESQLAQHDFTRVHHSHLINMRHVAKYVKGEGGHVVMTDNALVDVSRRRKEEFMRRLGS